MSHEVVLVGRGRSVLEYEFPSVTPHMAISSGVFAMRTRKPEHWVCLDSPKYFDRHGSTAQTSWRQDPLCTWWDALCDPAVRKHVPSVSYRKGYVRQVQTEPPYEYEWLMEVAGGLRSDVEGWQPGWGDFPNVDVVPYDKTGRPNFTRGGKVGGGTHKDVPSNTVMFAVQVAARLGYRHMTFVGVDLHSKSRVYDALKAWLPLCLNLGITWTCSSESSRLSEFMPVEVPA